MSSVLWHTNDAAVYISGRCGAPFVEMYGYGRGEGEADKADGG